MLNRNTLGVFLIGGVSAARKRGLDQQQPGRRHGRRQRDERQLSGRRLSAVGRGRGTAPYALVRNGHWRHPRKTGLLRAHGWKDRLDSSFCSPIECGL